MIIPVVLLNMTVEGHTREQATVTPGRWRWHCCRPLVRSLDAIQTVPKNREYQVAGQDNEAMEGSGNNGLQEGRGRA